MNRFKFKTTKSSSASTKALEAPVLVDSAGEYFMNISIGTPEIEWIGIVDTGSDLPWIQCSPCEAYCYKQKPPVFDPKQSSTFNTVTCDSKFCLALEGDERRCDQDQNICGYNYSYADASFTAGNMAGERITFGSTTGPPVTFQEIFFGCSHAYSGVFSDEVGSGVVGLGRGPLSLVSQLSGTIKGIFSYCLVPTSAQANLTSKINFGDSDLIVSSDNGVVTMRLVDNKEESASYSVTLEAISVGNKRLEYSITSEGNMIIDTGTTFTFLDPKFYETLAAAIEEQIGSKRVLDPRGYPTVCFKVEKEKQSDLPIITLHFAGAADLQLQSFNAFDELAEGDLMCLNMIPSDIDDPIATLGNLSQMNFLVGYDLAANTVSFNPIDCTKL